MLDRKTHYVGPERLMNGLFYCLQQKQVNQPLCAESSEPQGVLGRWKATVVESTSPPRSVSSCPLLSYPSPTCRPAHIWATDRGCRTCSLLHEASSAALPRRCSSRQLRRSPTSASGCPSECGVSAPSDHVSRQGDKSGGGELDQNHEKGCVKCFMGSESHVRLRRLGEEGRATPSGLSKRKASNEKGQAIHGGLLPVPQILFAQPSNLCKACSEVSALRFSGINPPRDHS